MTRVIKVVVEDKVLGADDGTKVICRRVDGSLHRVHSCSANMIGKIPEGWSIVYAIKRLVGGRVNDLLIEVESDIVEKNS